MQTSDSFWNVIQQYFKDCVLLPLFALAMIWLVKNGSKNRKNAFIALVCGSALIFNEAVYRIFAAAGEGSTYYRLFWIVPIGLAAAAFLVDCLLKADAGKRSMALIVSFLALWMFSGQTGTEWIALPETVYQVDADVIQVADLLMQLTDNRPTYLIDDGSVSNTIRQYNAKVMNTDMGLAAMDMILQGNDTNVLGRDIQIAIDNNRSRFIAINKKDTAIYKVLENAGVKLAGETDNYRIYYVHYEQQNKDVQALAEGMNMEYIPVKGMKTELEYVYITDFGTIENEAAYQNAIAEIEKIQPDGLIINDALSENAGWYEYYKPLLDELGIPCYCNETEFELISEEEVTICLIDNSKEISADTEDSLEKLLKEEKPVVLILSKEISNTGAGKLEKLILESENKIVQILSARKDNYEKNLIGKDILQFSAPTDTNQLLNIIRLEDLAPKEIIAY